MIVSEGGALGGLNIRITPRWTEATTVSYLPVTVDQPATEKEPGPQIFVGTQFRALVNALSKEGAFQVIPRDIRSECVNAIVVPSNQQ